MKKIIIAILLIHSSICLKAQNCDVKFWNHIDCIYDLKEVGFDVDTINSTMNAKHHYHSFSGTAKEGCWDIDVDTTIANFNCGICGYSDTNIYNFYFLPLSSKIYKSFSINNGTNTGKKMFDWNDIIYYKRNVVGFSIPEDPYCCTTTIPAACSSCNCGVGMVNWKAKEFALIPARGIYWENNCPENENN
jgi:hypothetical protein